MSQLIRETVGISGSSTASTRPPFRIQKCPQPLTLPISTPRHPFRIETAFNTAPVRAAPNTFRICESSSVGHVIPTNSQQHHRAETATATRRPTAINYTVCRRKTKNSKPLTRSEPPLSSLSDPPFSCSDVIPFLPVHTHWFPTFSPYHLAHATRLFPPASLLYSSPFPPIVFLVVLVAVVVCGLVRRVAYTNTHTRRFVRRSRRVLRASSAWTLGKCTVEVGGMCQRYWGNILSTFCEGRGKVSECAVPRGDGFVYYLSLAMWESKHSMATMFSFVF